MQRRACVFAVLVYLSLDLSLATMPGAFEFDIARSVESTQDSRTRVSAQSHGVVRPHATVAYVVPRPAIDGARWRRMPVGRRSRGTPAPSAPRASAPAVPPLDEPH